MSQRFSINVIEFSSPAYAESILIRHELLRAPLNLKFSEDELSQEWQSHHIAAYEEENGAMVGCLVLKPITESKLQMRQVAVLPKFQGHNVGRQLVKFSEQYASRMGYSEIILHARTNVVMFYIKLGYERSGPEFSEVGIPHQKMTKQLVTA